jgi:hypothetical protein
MDGLIAQDFNDIDAMCNLLDTCIAHGVPYDQEDAAGL